ncbi:Solute carrier family 35 member F6 [Turdus rufiventris]|nr:Solute carrier family 35 member F6 [Turdus rufiventris]
MAWSRYQLGLAALMLLTGSINTLAANASSFQMLRGSLIIFTGLLSVAFLGRRLCWSHWLGMALTVAGLALVGLADLRGSGGAGHGTAGVVTGDLLILLAQGIVSIQMVLEEKFIFSHDVHPLRAVGTEGLFGFAILALLLVPMSFIPAGRLSGNPRGVLEDPADAWCQIRREPLILAALLANVGSISFFNFAGLSVTRELSATTRTVLDSLRTLLVWAFSLALRWEHFHALQIPGFALLLVGAALYNGLHRALLPGSAGDGTESGNGEEREALLGADGDAENQG